MGDASRYKRGKGHKGRKGEAKFQGLCLFSRALYELYHDVYYLFLTHHQFEALALVSRGIICTAWVASTSLLVS